ncbi:MAG: CPBP family intramembrane metalloprotease [Planctomycetaceae bacterium]|nr:MAG: CPBP family intramembrane metalloprotease [Planctomycetaceae bacterium]
MTQSSDPERSLSREEIDRRPPNDLDLASDETVIITADLVPSPPTGNPPVWTAIVVSVAAIVLSAMVSVIVLVSAASMDQGLDSFVDAKSWVSWIEDFSRTRGGLLMVLLPSQTVFLLVACIAATVSPRPFARRLSLGVGILPLWTWVIFLIGTPIIGWGSSQILSLMVDELSENLEFIESMMRWHIRQSLPLLFVLVAIVPGVFEEVLFRGYLLTRLAERWHPFWAILVSAMIFSLAHLDPLHSLGVLPLGLWLGAVAWRTGSVWPAVLCHIANNAMAIVWVMLLPEGQERIAWDGITVVTLVVCTPAFLFSLWIFRNR